MAAMAKTEALLAIDGGGTQCRFALQQGAERTVVKGGPANAFTDFDASVACLLDGLRALSEQASIALPALYHTPAFVGLAGVVTSDIAARLQAALPLENARFADDRLSALSGALGGKDGIVAHCGTGSFFAANIGGQTRLAGGWGARLGDEASAQWVGRKALAAVLRATDGFEARTPFVEACLSRFGDPGGILRFAATAAPKDFGALAPEVVEHAEKGDAAAAPIMQAGAAYIADGLNRMGWTPDLSLCLTGGIGPAYARYLSSDHQAALTEPNGTPLDGAIRLAASGE